MLNTSLTTMSKKGIIESFVFGFSTIFTSVASKIKITSLKLRGYNIDNSVLLSGQNLFFQTEKKSITIKERTRIGYGVRVKAGFSGKISIGKNVLIDDYSFISAQDTIQIGDEAMIASHCYIVDFNHIYPLSKSKKNIGKKSGYITAPVKIGKYVWIGTHSVVLPGVTIGENAVIGAGSVVTKNIPANTIAVGNPAKVVKHL